MYIEYKPIIVTDAPDISATANNEEFLPLNWTIHGLDGLAARRVHDCHLTCAKLSNCDKRKWIHRKSHRSSGNVKIIHWSHWSSNGSRLAYDFWFFDGLNVFGNPMFMYLLDREVTDIYYFCKISKYRNILISQSRLCMPGFLQMIQQEDHSSVSVTSPDSLHLLRVCFDYHAHDVDSLLIF